jgi:K+-sensing histidine kinase KdpD
MMHAGRRALLRYATAVGASSVALVIALSIESQVDAGAFVVFLGAVAVSAWYGGLGPGLLATALGTLATSYLFVAPTASFGIGSLNAALQLAVFLLVALLVSSLHAYVYATHVRAEAARQQAEAAQRRLALIAEAGTQLSETLDYERTLQVAVRLAVPTLADWCEVHAAVDEDGGSRQLTATYRDASLASLTDTADHNGASESAAPSAVQVVVSSGQPTVFSQMSQTPFPARADGEHLDRVRALGYRSAMIVPLIAHGRTLGAMTLLATAPNRYGGPELALAEELARRAALAIDQARLYFRAQQAIRAREQLLATVSHDLRNPLAVIRGHAQQMRRRLARSAATDAELADGLARIEATTRTMAELIDLFVNAALAHAGRPLTLKQQPTDLVGLAREIVSEHRLAAPAAHVRFETAETELVAECDSIQLRRVIHNLLSNAEKYTPDGGEIILAVRREVSSPVESAVLEVRDRGLGIPATERHRVFEPFFRGSNVVGQIAGSGLGLAGAQQIVREHGGNISIESQEDAGTTVTVRLPLQATNPTPASQAIGSGDAETSERG